MNTDLHKGKKQLSKYETCESELQYSAFTGYISLGIQISYEKTHKSFKQVQYHACTALTVLNPNTSQFLYLFL